MLFEDKMACRRSSVSCGVILDAERITELRSISGDGLACHVKAVTSMQNEVRVSIQFCTANIVLITHTYAEDEPAAYPLARTDWDTVPRTFEEREDGYLISGDRIKVLIETKPFRIRVLDHEGKPVWQQQVSNSNSAGQFLSNTMGRGRSNVDGASCVSESVEFSPDEKIYGFGERFDELNKAGKRIITQTQAPLASNPSTSYKPIPFYISSSGYGLLVNTLEPITFDIGSKSYEAISIAHRGLSMDYFLIVDSDPKEIIRGYHLITGLPEIPPEWSFGYVQSSALFRMVDGTIYCGYVTRDEVMEVAKRLREEDIPCDCITLDGSWSGDYGPSDDRVFDWQFCPRRFPEPEKMAAELNETGFKLCVTQWPYLRPFYPDFQDAKDKGLFVKDRNGEVYIDEVENYAFLDLTNPRAYEWLKDKNRAIRDSGIVSLMADFCEDYPLDGVYSSGISGNEAHNLMPILYQKALHEVTQETTGERGFLWARAGYTGAQMTPGHWAGDNHSSFQSLAAVVRAGLGFGLSGCPIWGHDIGGWFGERFEGATFGPPTKELFIRWAQFGFFSPWLRSHGSTEREPWTFDEETLAIFKKYARFRSRLIPYIYSAALDSRDTGAPIMRAMFLEFPDDPTCWSLERQYMFGDALMVVPVCAEVEDVLIYFPAGRWQDIWTGEVISGPSWQKYQAPLDTIPVFQRENTILPLGPLRQHVGETSPEPLELRAFVGSSASVSLRGDGRALSVSVERGANGLLSVTQSRGEWAYDIVDR